MGCITPFIVPFRRTIVRPILHGQGIRFPFFVALIKWLQFSFSFATNSLKLTSVATVLESLRVLPYKCILFSHFSWLRACWMPNHSGVHSYTQRTKCHLLAGAFHHWYKDILLAKLNTKRTKVYPWQRQTMMDLKGKTLPLNICLFSLLSFSPGLFSMRGDTLCPQNDLYNTFHAAGECRRADDRSKKYNIL